MSRRLTDQELAKLPPLERRTAQSQRNLNDRTYNIRSARTARERRLGRQIVDDLSDLAPPEPQPTLRREEPRGGIPAARGHFERNYQPGEESASTAGIASPLTEGAQPSEGGPILDRDYYDPVQLTTTDGLFVMEVEYLKTIRLVDAQGNSAVINLASPPAP